MDLPTDKNGTVVLPGDKFVARCGHVITVRPFEAHGYCDEGGCFDMSMQLPARRWARDGIVRVESDEAAAQQILDVAVAYIARLGFGAVADGTIHGDGVWIDRLRAVPTRR